MSGGISDKTLVARQIHATIAHFDQIFRIMNEQIDCSQTFRITRSTATIAIFDNSQPARQQQQDCSVQKMAALLAQSCRPLIKSIDRCSGACQCDISMWWC